MLYAYTKHKYTKDLTSSVINYCDDHDTTSNPNPRFELVYSETKNFSYLITSNIKTFRKVILSHLHSLFNS